LTIGPLTLTLSPAGSPFFPLSEIRQINIRRHLKKMIVDKKDEV
jgi:hypothetical protein